MNAIEFMKLEEEMLNKHSVKIKNRFLEGIVEGIGESISELNTDSRVTSDTFKSRRLITLFEQNSFTWKLGGSFAPNSSDTIRKIFNEEASEAYADSTDEVTANEAKDIRTWSNKLEIHGIIKDAIVSVDIPTYRHPSTSWDDDTLPFKVHYRYSERETAEKELLRLAYEQYHRLKIGDKVVHKHGQPLRSGACEYTYAVVHSLDPFILKSEQRDMTWNATVREEDYIEWVPF